MFLSIFYDYGLSRGIDVVSDVLLKTEYFFVHYRFQLLEIVVVHFYFIHVEAFGQVEVEFVVVVDLEKTA